MKARLASTLAILLVAAPWPARAATVIDDGYDDASLSHASAVVVDGANSITASEASVRRKGLHSARVDRGAGALRSYLRYDLSPARPQLAIRLAVRIASNVVAPAGAELMSLVGADATRPLAALVLETDGTLALAGDDGTGSVVVTQPSPGFDDVLARDHWYELEIRYHAGSVPPAAGIEVFRDGVRVLSRTSVGTGGNVQSANVGQRAAWASFAGVSGSLYYDIVKADDAAPVGPENDHPALVLVDRSNPSAYATYASARIKNALDFWGLAYREVDLSSEPVTSSLLSTADLVVIGQEHVGAALGTAGQAAIATAVQGGMGLVGLDPWAGEYANASFQSALGSPSYGSATTTLQFTTNDPASHFVLAEQPAGVDDPTNPSDSNVRTYFSRPGGDIAFQSLASAGSATVLATCVGVPAVISRSAGSGRVVWWFLSNQLWDNAVDTAAGGSSEGAYHPTLRIGHVHGIDDVLWRSIVWAHRKPMLWNPLPRKLAALKVDDARGRSLGGSAAFDYADSAMTILGVPIQSSLFLNAIASGSLEALALASLQSSEQLEVSAHAFDGGDTNPAQPTSDFLYWKRQTGASGETLTDDPFGDSTLAARWSSIDSFFSARGLTMSKWLAPHDAVAGTNNLPYLAARGIIYAHTVHDLAASSGHGQDDWLSAKPFGSGCHALDYMAGGSPVFAVSSYADCAFWNFDFDVKQGAVAPVDNRDEAVANALLQARLAHGSRFPMLFLTHEYVIDADGFSLTDWEYIVTHVRDALASDSEVLWVSPTELARQSREHAGNRILSLTRTGNQFELLLEGASSAGTSVELWRTGEARSRLTIPAFSGTSYQTPVAQCGRLSADDAPVPLAGLLPILGVVGYLARVRARFRAAGSRGRA